MYCAHSSEWGLFGRNTRSAIRGTSSSPPREERADIGKDDVVEARKWIPNTPYIINTRARRCACIFIRLVTIKASNCIIVSLDSRRRFILAVYPPKLSNIIMSSSTPKEWSKSSTVFDSSERPCNKELAWLVGVAGVLPLPKNRQIFGSPV